MSFRFVFRPAGFQKLNEPVRLVIPVITPARAAEHYDWSPTEIASMANITDEDLDETRAWLKRIGASEALAAFDA